jgi:hypothetical protein
VHQSVQIIGIDEHENAWALDPETLEAYLLGRVTAQAGDTVEVVAGDRAQLLECSGRKAERIMESE